MKRKSVTKNLLFISLISFLCLWGVFLRAPEMISGNYLFGHDTGRDYLAAYNIVVNHKLTLIGAEAGSGVAGINGIFHGPGYFYLIALAFLLFHGDPIGGQFFMFLFGVATLILSTWAGYKMFGKIGSVLFLFFTAVSPLIISQSRFIWSSHPLTFFVILAIYFVYRIPDNPELFAPLAVFTSGFTYNSQLGVAVPLMVSILLSIPIVFKVRNWRVYVYSIVGAIFAFLPMILFDVRHNFMAARSAFAYVSAGGSGSSSIFEAKRLHSHIFDYWNNFYNTFTFEFGWIPWKIQIIVLEVATVFAGIGLWMVKDGRLKKIIFFLLLMSAFTWIAYLLLNNTVWDYYLTHTRIGYILLFTIAGISLYRSYKKWPLAKIGAIVGIVFLFVVFYGSIFRQYVSYTIDIKDTGIYDKIQGKRFVIDTIYKDAGGKPFSVFVFMPSVYTWPYDYLFKTYGLTRYGYEPAHVKNGLAYLIIEPDQSQPWRQNGWLVTVVEGGTTLWTKTLLNGLILIKRIY